MRVGERRSQRELCCHSAKATTMMRIKLFKDAMNALSAGRALIWEVRDFL
jgi:hypothetical protein